LYLNIIGARIFVLYWSKNFRVEFYYWYAVDTCEGERERWVDPRRRERSGVERWNGGGRGA